MTTNTTATGWQCAECEHRFDAIIRTIEDEAALECPQCHSSRVFECADDHPDCCGGCINLPPSARNKCR